MFDSSKTLAHGTMAIAALAGAGLMASSGAMSATTSFQAQSDDVRCTIAIKDRSGGVALEGRVAAAKAVDGSYRLTITKSGGGGSSDIYQSGEFAVAPGEETSLATVMLAGEGGSFTAKLKVTWDGRSTECRQNVHGNL